MGFKNHFVHTKVGKYKIILHKTIFFIVLIAMCIFLDYRCSNSGFPGSHLLCNVCVPILVTTFPEWLSGTEPLPHTPGAVRPSSLCL